ncbi:oligopeptide ABC transporter ATP-binding protein [Sulfolobales archaeon HS-7]|nr:oligopeptide ABC transporter ATP-binding protein [Sulfolobales archaeon HS-7]
MSKLIELIHVYKDFIVRTGLLRKEHRPGIWDVNMEIRENEIVGMVGGSGGGKTVIAWMIVGLLKPTKGSIMYYPMGLDVTKMSKKELRRYRADVNLVFQDPYSSLDPTHTVKWHIERPLKLYKYNGDIEERVVELLKEVSLSPPEEFLYKYPFQLSGGQRQRVYLARVLALNPKVLVADEPVSNVDASIRASLLELFKRLRDEKGISIMYITHDIATIGYVADRVYVVKQGRIVEEGDVERVITNPQNEYTKLLTKVVPNPYTRID